MPISVLIADDERDLVEVLGLLLEAMDYKVYTALDGAGAVTVLEKAKPDVLILDMNMPGLKGDAVLATMARMGLKTKVIVSTGRTQLDDEFKKQMQDFGVAAVVEKPVTVEELDGVIKQVLNG
jgi:CheY-like chemotaxis protein